MKPQNNKMTLVMAIIITIIFLPLAILSTYGHVLYGKKDEATCDLKLIGGSCYTCENKSGYCNYAYSYVNDGKYILNYYKGTNSFLTTAGSYVFLMDSPTTFNTTNVSEYPNTIMYSTTSGSKLKVNGLNNYGIGFVKDYYIGILENGKYTLFQIDEVARRVINDEYDFLGAANHFVDGKLDSSIFVALKNNKWQLIDPTNIALTVEFARPIYDYNDKTVALYNDAVNKYYLVDYQGSILIDSYFDKIVFYQNIILGVSNKTLYIFDSKTNSILSSNIKLNSYDDITVSENTDYIDISIAGFKNTRVYYGGTIFDISNLDDNSTTGDNTNTQENNDASSNN